MNLMPDFLVALRVALRARFLSFVLWLSVALVAAIWMAAQFSARQSATVALDAGISVIRLGLPVISVLLLQELFSREFDRKFILNSLAYPRCRRDFLTGRFAAVALLLIGSLVWLSALLGSSVTLIERGYAQSTPVALGVHYLVTMSFVALDIFVVTAMGVLLAVVASAQSFVLIGTLGFMLVARSFSPIIALLERESYLVVDPEGYRGSLELLGYLLPDLAALDVRMIALYGKMNFLPKDWAMNVVATLSYAFGLCFLAVWSFDRKQFE